MSSEWSASQRYELTSAPGGLGLVQEFLNTMGIEGYGPDLLADTALAGDWAASAVRTWSALRGVDAQPPSLDAADLSKLRALRDTIAKLVAGPDEGQALYPLPSRCQTPARYGWNLPVAAGVGWPQRSGGKLC
jgi:Putative stress-induced transcription regulator